MAVKAASETYFSGVKGPFFDTFYQLTIYDICAITKVCKEWRKAFVNLEWNVLFVRDFPKSKMEKGLSDKENYVTVFCAFKAGLKKEIAAHDRALSAPAPQLVLHFKAKIPSVWYGNLPGLSLPANAGIKEIWEAAQKEILRLRKHMEKQHEKLALVGGRKAEKAVIKLNTDHVRETEIEKRLRWVNKSYQHIVQLISIATRSLANIPKHARAAS
jgi:uncharacterized protein (DUF2267 family)